MRFRYRVLTIVHSSDKREAPKLIGNELRGLQANRSLGIEHLFPLSSREKPDAEGSRRHLMTIERRNLELKQRRSRCHSRWPTLTPPRVERPLGLLEIRFDICETVNQVSAK